jgi:hypothetical protein
LIVIIILNSGFQFNRKDGKRSVGRQYRLFQGKVPGFIGLHRNFFIPQNAFKVGYESGVGEAQIFFKLLKSGRDFGIIGPWAIEFLIVLYKGIGGLCKGCEW